jgi:hypothetical protein
MTTTTAPASLPTVPPEVTAFAAEAGVTADLPAVLALTRRQFPAAPLSVRLDIDPEEPGDRRILIGVTLPDWTVEEYLAWRRQWTEGLFAICPATRSYLFGLEIDPDGAR